MRHKFKESLLKRSVLSGAILGVLSSAQGGTINIDGDCTLEDAIQSANGDVAVGSCSAGAGDDVIQFVNPDSSLTINTIFEPSSSGLGDTGLPVINSNITIEGNGVTIRANNSNYNFRIFDVFTSGDLTLRDTTVSNANDGLGIGSGLFSIGRVTIENSTFAQNNGGVFLYGGFGNEINNSVIRHNYNNDYFAAGVQTYFSELSINDSSIFDNVHNANALRGGTGTAAGGLGLMQSDVTINNSTISGNQSVYGGGITLNADTPAPLPSLSPRFGNSPYRGVIQSELTITNSTITNNQSYIAGGILQFNTDSAITIQGSIIAGNKIRYGGYANNGYLFNPANVVLDANNIIGENSTTGFNDITLGASDSTFSNEPEDNLYPLSLSNGQFVHPLRTGSIAIDGNDLACFGGILDQEGKTRGIDGDDNGSFICDVGAFEHSLPILADAGPCTLSNAILSANNDASVGGCQPGLGHDIINLPENSTQVLNIVQATSSLNPAFVFGLPQITSGITIEGNGSTITRDMGAASDFDILLAEFGAQINIFNTNITGSNGAISAILTYGGNLNLVDSTVSGNQVPALLDAYSVNTSVVGSTLDSNTYGLVGYSDSYGALSAVGSVGLEVRNNTISNNDGGRVGGSFLFGNISMLFENNTISGNTAQSHGGMLVINGSPRKSIINFNTITNNEGGVVGGLNAQTEAVDTLELRNSIVSGNVLAPLPPPAIERTNLLSIKGGTNRGAGYTPAAELSGSAYLTMDANNIIGQNGDSGSADVVLGTSDVVPAGPTNTVIDALADNGGNTLTHLPVAGGLAVDTAGTNCGPNTDQIGRIRPWDGDNNGSPGCDVGAVEFGSVTSSDLIFKDGFDPTIVLRRSLKK